MNWSSTWDDKPSSFLLAPISPEDTKIIERVKGRYQICESWEANARLLWDYDYKFANADAHNKYQWDNDLVMARELEDKPCLTINKTQQHNLMVINDAKQNKPGIRIRPVGDEATYDGAQIYQDLVYHIEYISNAEAVYDYATKFQVDAGMGYWRVCTDYVSDDSFDQEIYIRRIRDPRAVYLDPDINEIDGSDARFGYIFEDIAKDLFKEKYPKFADIGSSQVLGNNLDGWITQNHIRVAEYYEKEEKEDKLVTWINNQTGIQVLSRLSKLDDTNKLMYKEIIAGGKPVKEMVQYQERRVLTTNIKWYKIAGDRIIDRGDWLGKYIPIVRLPGTETVIDGIWDSKGHTRALINAQQMYNYNTSANVEYGALQTKAPWVAPSAAIENFEEYYKTANRVNHAYLPYNHIDEDGNPIPPPQRPAAPQASPAYVEQMKIAQNEMMMATGQYQAQLGENENAKSGVAINARQRQGDRATYHFIDNQAIAIRFTGKIVIDLIPKIYDTARIKKIIARDGTRMDVKIDPNFKGATQDITPEPPKMDAGQKIKEVMFNPDFGMYDIQSDTGPSFATRRLEAFNALTQIASSNEKFMDIAGDILWKVADFPEADILAQRWNRIIPPNVKGEGIDPQIEQLMQGAEAKITQLSALVAKQAQQIADKDRELTQAGQKIDLEFRKAGATEAREDYKAETQRMKDIMNTADDNTGIDPALEKVLKQLIRGMLANGELDSGKEMEDAYTDKIDEDLPEGAKLAPDGNHYVQNEDGSHSLVEMQ